MSHLAPPRAAYLLQPPGQLGLGLAGLVEAASLHVRRQQVLRRRVARAGMRVVVALAAAELRRAGVGAGTEVVGRQLCSVLADVPARGANRPLDGVGLR